MFSLSEPDLEWSLKHLLRFHSSDFFPKVFEFDAIKADWQRVREHLLTLDLEAYVPKTPFTLLAPKANGTFRAVHQLEPLDALIYTALTKRGAEVFENYRIAESEGIACSYRIVPDLNGSFFGSSEDGWSRFNERTRELAQEYSDGVILLCDFVDFYNQIYTHRLRNVIAEAGGTTLEEYAKVVEHFLHGLNDKTSRGIPVGPAASIVLAEVVLSDIDRKILSHTSSFIRWVDDFRVFFPTVDDARSFLHEFTKYLYELHRLVLSGEKTRLLNVVDYTGHIFQDDEETERLKRQAKVEEVALAEYLEELHERAGPYNSPEDDFDEEEYSELQKRLYESNRVDILASTYGEILSEQLKRDTPDFVLLRRVFKNAARYRIRAILKTTFEHLERLLPVIREIAIYARSTLTASSANDIMREFSHVLDLPVFRLPYVNLWISYILQDDSFNSSPADIGYASILSLRDQALVARRKRDRVWIKSHKSGLDVLGPWERRAILFGASVLSRDEMNNWLRVAGARGDAVEHALSVYMRTIQT
jgi:Reverse transcriptase (RNA-dependent DNA polymerase)